MTAIAIMQPTYLPWLGYFALMDRVDVFVLLDNVQFDRRSWQQRNRIKTQNDPIWLSVPVQSKGKRDQHIADTLIDDTRGFAQNHIRSITANYAKAPYFKDLSRALFEVLESNGERLADLSAALIIWLRDTLGIKTPLRRSSEFSCQGSKAELLAELCMEIGADRYVSPPGSKNYIDQSDAFSRRAITVSYHEYEHPTYPQLFGPFVAYLSVIDLLFNAGPDSLGIIRQGCVQTS